METIRKPYQGVWNIIRFNRHFYLLAFVFILLGLSVNFISNNPYVFYINLLIIIAIFAMISSLLVSLYIYDLSSLYSFKILDNLDISVYSKIVNIHAGFDETSILIKDKFPTSNLLIYDFYNSKIHTEISIKRARKIYPNQKDTISIETSKIPLNDNEVDLIMIFFSAHEIRNKEERNVFFKELNRILKPNGKIILTEHLRDFNNFLAYNIGFFHFHSLKTWKNAFQNADLKMVEIKKHTPFITYFILQKNGNPS